MRDITPKSSVLGDSENKEWKTILEMLSKTNSFKGYKSVWDMLLAMYCKNNRRLRKNRERLYGGWFSVGVCGWIKDCVYSGNSDLIDVLEEYSFL